MKNPRAGASRSKKAPSFSANLHEQLAALRTIHSPDSYRTRVLDTAGRLFYRHGIRTVSVDVIAKEAGTNKVTLYKYFSSKDQLVAEYLRRLTSELDLAWDAVDRAFPNDPEARLRVHIDQEIALLMSPSEYATAFVNAFVELMQPDHPAWPVIRAQKIQILERFNRLFRAAKIKQPERLADKVYLLTEGARIAMQCFPSDGPSSRIAGILKKTIEDHVRPVRPKSFLRKGKLRKLRPLPSRRELERHYNPKLPLLTSTDTAVPMKERLIVAAGELFQKHGIHAVSVEAIAKAAGTNKKTLYYHYASKDVLITAYLQSLVLLNEVRWAHTELRYPDPWKRIRVLLAGVYDAVTSSSTSGGAMSRARIELKEIDHPAHAITEGIKKIFWKKQLTLFQSAQMFDPEYLADIVTLMLEGGRMSTLCYGPDGPSARAGTILAAIYEDYANRVK
jgi:AcrR family transcriptional regulator